MIAKRNSLGLWSLLRRRCWWGRPCWWRKLLPFFHRFDNAPLIQPILFQTFVYWAVVFLDPVLEKLVEDFVSGGRIDSIPEAI